MTSAFAQLPAAVLGEILWLTPFVDTLRCEQVCRSWKKVLKCATAATEGLYPTRSPAVLGQELHLLVAKPKEDWAASTLKLDQSADKGQIVITLVPSRDDSAHFYEVFLLWLTKHAAGFLKVVIRKSATQSSWVFAQIVLAIGTASLSAPPLSAVCLIAGELHPDALPMPMHCFTCLSPTVAGMFTCLTLNCCSSSELTTAGVMCRLWGAAVTQLLQASRCCHCQLEQLSFCHNASRTAANHQPDKLDRSGRIEWDQSWRHDRTQASAALEQLVSVHVFCAVQQSGELHQSAITEVDGLSR